MTNNNCTRTATEEQYFKR